MRTGNRIEMTGSEDLRRACSLDDGPRSQAPCHVPGETWLDKVRARVCAYRSWGRVKGVSGVENGGS
ncbi:hypothetical protein NDU88_001452 [Pleurodeles waltl]|uniref:Uncharacterized protein n=1 Tax=Pleurodeles waltl TaxID=8319 RepID=A0AAV7RBP0_PLEWA|nr:hypothetical protein NDU88_001452 [Pleurodeles waltl]